MTCERRQYSEGSGEGQWKGGFPPGRRSGNRGAAGQGERNSQPGTGEETCWLLAGFTLIPVLGGVVAALCAWGQLDGFIGVAEFKNR